MRHQPKLDEGKIEKLIRFLGNIDASTPALAEAIRDKVLVQAATNQVPS